MQYIHTSIVEVCSNESFKKLVRRISVILQQSKCENLLFIFHIDQTCELNKYWQLIRIYKFPEQQIAGLSKEKSFFSESLDASDGRIAY